MANLDLIVPPRIRMELRFDAHVKITGAPAGGKVLVMLQQTRGKEPLYGECSQEVTTNADGKGHAHFREVALQGTAGTTTYAVLVASAADGHATPYKVDAEVVHVEGDR